MARAAIIDFGGFLGVGSRKIAVAWQALHFVPQAEKRYGIVLDRFGVSWKVMVENGGK